MVRSISYIIEIKINYRPNPFTDWAKENKAKVAKKTAKPKKAVNPERKRY